MWITVSNARTTISAAFATPTISSLSTRKQTNPIALLSSAMSPTVLTVFKTMFAPSVPPITLSMPQEHARKEQMMSHAPHIVAIARRKASVYVVHTDIFFKKMDIAILVFH